MEATELCLHERLYTTAGYGTRGANKSTAVPAPKHHALNEYKALQALFLGTRT
jgi:hypothetical protein